mmetsp:Transcript_60591/g.180192  ORF Transcript_60591/g.180192 Transcript_60591/m.180192 type:complete len:229 (-) Transcript_60591:1238-1924(-)
MLVPAVRPEQCHIGHCIHRRLRTANVKRDTSRCERQHTVLQSRRLQCEVRVGTLRWAPRTAPQQHRLVQPLVAAGERPRGGLLQQARTPQRLVVRLLPLGERCVHGVDLPQREAHLLLLSAVEDGPPRLASARQRARAVYPRKLGCVQVGRTLLRREYDVALARQQCRHVCEARSNCLRTRRLRQVGRRSPTCATGVFVVLAAVGAAVNVWESVRQDHRVDARQRLLH